MSGIIRAGIERWIHSDLFSLRFATNGSRIEPFVRRTFPYNVPHRASPPLLGRIQVRRLVSHPPLDVEDAKRLFREKFVYGGKVSKPSISAIVNAEVARALSELPGNQNQKISLQTERVREKIVFPMRVELQKFLNARIMTLYSTLTDGDLTALAESFIKNDWNARMQTAFVKFEAAQKSIDGDKLRGDLVQSASTLLSKYVPVMLEILAEEGSEPLG